MVVLVVLVVLVLLSLLLLLLFLRVSVESLWLLFMPLFVVLF